MSRTSLGFIEISGVVAATDALDIMCKTSGVELATWERKLGGRLVTIVIRGDVASVTEAVEAVINGEAIAVDWCKGLADGAVYLSPLNTDIAAEGTQEAIDAATEAIKSGELHVFAGPLKGVSPEGVEIEVAEGDYFHEQEEASAPAWSYIVEGCNVAE